VVQAARRVEDAGLDAVGVSEVLVGDGTPALEPVVLAATVAAVTERVHLDFGVLAASSRPAAMLAAQVQALQHLSGGRVRLGLGIGGFPGSPFWRALGAPTTTRGRALDALLEVLPGLFAGRSTAVPAPGGPVEVTLAPPVPAPPLLIGGSDHEAVLLRTVRLADGWMPFALSPQQVAAAAARLRELAAAHGRTPPEIHLGLHAVLGDRAEDRAAARRMRESLGGFYGLSAEEMVDRTLAGTPQQVAERVAEYAAAGVDHLGIGLDADVERQISLVGEVRALIPAAGRAPAGTPR
jgi:alkanesulfonate monooxygenase SsuD/methylene tetrahydromethanopterin reductase-like flavin-dependent oxidoreductase (luciferase family)